MDNNQDYTLKPDYYADDSVLKITECFKDDFYALSAERAKILFNLGLPVYKLTAVELKSRVNYAADIMEYRSYGIYKEVWELFLRTEDGENFVQIWGFVSNIAQSFKGDMMVNVENGAAVPMCYEEIYADESSCIENYFDEKDDEEESLLIGDVRTKVKKYLVPLVFEYSDRLSRMFNEAKAHVSGRRILIKLLATATQQLCGYIEG